jgi:autoinducer 2-degrading protein
MLIYCVTVYVKPEFHDAFKEATLENAQKTREEPKNIRFDVLECLDEPNRFFLYEIYRDSTGVDDHKETSHYQKWRETVEKMMEKPRVGVKHKEVFPFTEEAFLSN